MNKNSIMKHLDVPAKTMALELVNKYLEPMNKLFKGKDVEGSTYKLCIAIARAIVKERIETYEEIDQTAVVCFDNSMDSDLRKYAQRTREYYVQVLSELGLMEIENKN